MTVKADYFNDVLCIWAYIAQIKVDELNKQFASDIELEYRYLPLFTDYPGRMHRNWQEKGGMQGLNRMMQKLAHRYDYIEVHPEVCLMELPASSATAHEFLKALQLLERREIISSAREPKWHLRRLSEQFAWEIRLRFFRDGDNISRRHYLMELTESFDIPRAPLEAVLNDGEALASLFDDAAAKEKMLIEGSPTFVFNEGRQKLYGNVGYRIIEANVQELLSHAETDASWC